MYKITIYKCIKEALKHYPVVIVTGPRQVGKSTEVYKLVEELGFHYASLDSISNRSEAIEDPEFFIQSRGIPLIIDEVQYAPIFMEIIESIVNKKRLEEGSANGMFVLTGSQSYEMMQGVTQSLAGRACVLKMLPLSYSEVVSKEEVPFVPSMDLYKKEVHSIDVKELYKIIVRGYYPELYKDKELSTSQFYENYVSTYIDRDVSELINIKDKLYFHRFLQYISSLIGQQINYNDISRNIGIDVKTIKSWMSILESSGIIYLLQPYSEYKLTKRIVKSPKIYFVDTGLAAHLSRVNNPDYLIVSNLAGAYFENYVINEIKKSYENNGLKFNGYYYRDNNQNEIDLILLYNSEIHCIEIKKGSLFNSKHVKSFKQLSNSQYNIGISCIICNTENNYAINRDVLVYSVMCI